MKETPLLFKPEMVRATLDLQKNKTRRLSGLKKINESPSDWTLIGQEVDRPWLWKFFNSKMPLGEKYIFVKCPYGQAGDGLWVRHTWWECIPPPTNPDNYQIWDEFTRCVRWKTGEQTNDVKPVLDLRWRKRPSIFLPRWASRITLDIVNVRVERLQSITEEDAIAEGVQCSHVGGPHEKCDARDKFRDLWNRIHSKDGFSWEKNPWLWVIEFKRRVA